MFECFLFSIIYFLTTLEFSHLNWWEKMAYDYAYEVLSCQAILWHQVLLVWN